MKKSYLIIFFLVCVKIGSTYLDKRLKDDRKFIDKIMVSEIERKEADLAPKMSRINTYTKTKPVTATKEIIENLYRIEKEGNNHKWLKVYLEDLKEQLEILHDFTPDSVDQYPPSIRFYKLKSQFINYLRNHFSEIISRKKYTLFEGTTTHIRPIITDLKYLNSDSVILEIQPFLNSTTHSSTEIFIKNKKTNITKFPFYYEGEAKDIRCEIQYSSTERKRSYEGK